MFSVGPALILRVQSGCIQHAILDCVIRVARAGILCVHAVILHLSFLKAWFTMGAMPYILTSLQPSPSTTWYPKEQLLPQVSSIVFRGKLPASIGDDICRRQHHHSYPPASIRLVAQTVVGVPVIGLAPGVFTRIHTPNHGDDDASAEIACCKGAPDATVKHRLTNAHNVGAERLPEDSQLYK